MKRKNIVKLIIIAFLFIAVICLYKLVQIYAVFYSEGQGVLQINQATWTILVNETNIVSGGDTISFTVNNVEFTSSDRVLEGNIAPGMSARFNIVINPSGTDVAIRYDVTINEDEITNDSIVIDTVTDVNGNSLIKTGQYTYTGIFSLAEVQANNYANIQVGVIWENNEENNVLDTEIGTQDSPAIQIPISVNVSQYIGETIVEYNEGS